MACKLPLETHSPKRDCNLIDFFFCNSIFVNQLAAHFRSIFPLAESLCLSLSEDCTTLGVTTRSREGLELAVPPPGECGVTVLSGESQQLSCLCSRVQDKHTTQKAEEVHMPRSPN